LTFATYALDICLEYPAGDLDRLVGELPQHLVVSKSISSSFAYSFSELSILFLSSQCTVDLLKVFVQS